MAKEEREHLIRQLMVESGRMKNEFAILVDRVRESLEQKSISVNNLRVLITHSDRNEVVNLFKKKKTNITDLFCALKDYWSFFDYEFLAVIIKRHCPELKPELGNYEESLKLFCRRRLCEIPSNIFKTKKGHKNNLYIKYNQKVDKMKLETAKQLQHKLSELLETQLYLLEVKEGCVELVFDSFCDLDDQFSLSKQRKEQLRNMGVLEIRNGDYKCFVGLNMASEVALPGKANLGPVSESLAGPDSSGFVDTDSGNDSMSLGSSVSDSAGNFNSFCPGKLVEPLSLWISCSPL